MVYRMSRTCRDGSIVDGPATEIVDKLQAISDASVGDNGGGGTKPAVGVMEWRNDALEKVKGPEKGGRIHCLGRVVVSKGQGFRSQEDQVRVLKARINELRDEIKEMKEKRADEVRGQPVNFSGPVP